MILVDTSIMAYLYLPTHLSESAGALLNSDSDWAVPVLWRSEFWNILAGYLRRGDLTFDAALATPGEAEALVAGAEHEVSSGAVLDRTLAAL